MYGCFYCLNTSHVSVTAKFQKKILCNGVCLNTSHVSVTVETPQETSGLFGGLNTSHVSVTVATGEEITKAFGLFKYISCFSYSHPPLKQKKWST